LKIRSSSYDCARRCEKRLYWKYIRGLVPNKVDRNDLYFGSALHEAIDKIHSGEDFTTVWKTYDLSMASKDKNPQVGMVLCKMYARKPFKPLTSEKSFEFFIGKHKWVGRFDLITEINNALSVVDHKTTRWGITGKYALQTKPNNQFISYVLGGRIYFKDIDSIIVNVFNVKDMKIDRLYVSFSSDEINEWIEETKLFLAHLVRCVNSEHFPKSNDCRLYGYDCVYKKLCLSGNPQGFIDRMFHVDQEAIDMSW